MLFIIQVKVLSSCQVTFLLYVDLGQGDLIFLLKKKVEACLILLGALNLTTLGWGNDWLKLKKLEHLRELVLLIQKIRFLWLFYNHHTFMVAATW